MGIVAIQVSHVLYHTRESLINQYTVTDLEVSGNILLCDTGPVSRFLQNRLAAGTGAAIGIAA